MTTLADLKIGDRAKIIGFNEVDKAYRQRLLTMGLTRGVEFEVLQIAPLGDPIEIKLRGFALSLRKHEAMGLELEKCE